jgi:hypothetical protein
MIPDPVSTNVREKNESDWMKTPGGNPASAIIVPTLLHQEWFHERESKGENKSKDH